MRGHRADANLAAFFLYVGEVFDAADVDQHLGLREAQLHRRYQAVSAGEEFGVVLVLGQKRERFIKAFCGNVFELSWNHDLLPD